METTDNQYHSKTKKCRFRQNSVGYKNTPVSELFDVRNKITNLAFLFIQREQPNEQ